MPFLELDLHWATKMYIICSFTQHERNQDQGSSRILFEISLNSGSTNDDIS
jgi:hypothetical protein